MVSCFRLMNLLILVACFSLGGRGMATVRLLVPGETPLQPPVRIPPSEEYPAGPEGGPGSAPYPVEQVVEWLLRVDDGGADEVLSEVEPLIQTHPGDLNLRYVRVEAQAARDPWAFVAAQSGGTGAGEGLFPSPDRLDIQVLPPLGQTPADVLESRWRLVIRFRLERKFYRGDRTELPEDYIKRMGQLAEAVWKEVGEFRPGTRRVERALVWTAALLCDQEYPEDADLGDAGHVLGDYFYAALVDLKVNLVGWTSRELLASTSPSAARYYLQQSAALGLSPVDRAFDLEKYLSTHSVHPTLQDDFHLAIGQGFVLGVLGDDDAEPHFEQIVREGWHNTTREASFALGAIWRRRGEEKRSIGLYLQLQERWGEVRMGANRALGRSYGRQKDYEKSVASLRQWLEGPRANGQDYLYLAQVAHHVTSPRDALSLAEFGVAVRRRELQVEGWRTSRAPQLVNLQSRLFELEALGVHAQIFPLTFVGLGVGLFLDILGVALALMVLATWPRVTLKVWRLALGVALGVGLLRLLSLMAPLPVGLGIAGHGAWVLWGILRSFVVTGAVLCLGVVLHLPVTPLLRGHPRRFRSAWFLLILAPVAFVLGILAEPLAAAVYLDQLPTTLMAETTGSIPPGARGQGDLLLRCTHLLSFGPLIYGLFPALILLGLRPYLPRFTLPLACGLAVVLQLLLVAAGLEVPVGWGWVVGVTTLTTLSLGVGLDVSLTVALCWTFGHVWGGG